MHTPTSVSIREIPLFPLLEVVLFPDAELSLHIYENRYKQMINDLMSKDRQFGVLMLDKNTGKAFSVGCAAHVKQTLYLPDGRINIVTQGLNRFKLLEITNHKPYLTGLVKCLNDDQPKINLVSLQQQIKSLISDIVRLTNKLSKSLIKAYSNQQLCLPVNLPTDPTLFSFWVANNLFSDPSEKQVLLEITDTKVRLEQEIISLKTLSKELAARAAIEDAFS